MPKKDPLKNRLEELFTASPEPVGRFSEETGEYSPVNIQTELDQYSSVTEVSSAQLHEKRVRELNCLNEIGFRIDEKPAISEFLEWVSRLIPTALFHPEIGTAAITYYDETYGDETAVHLTSKIVAGIRIAGNLIGYVHVAYREPKHFADEESAFLGAVTGRITGYLENQYLFDQMEKRSEALVKFKKGIDLSTDAVFITDVDGKISYTNDAFERTYGFTKSEAIGNTPRIIKSGLITQQQYKYFWETLLSGEIVTGELVNKTKTGQLISIDGANIPIIDEQDEILGFLAIHRDISEQKQDKNLVTKRASDLEAVAQLSTSISAILEPDRLLQTVVDLSCSMFNLYHAHVYLLDLSEQVLTLTSGSGEAGRKMVQRNWSIPLTNEHSIVAKAARDKQGLIINDVQKEATFLKNPLLPDTNAELAVPIIVRDQVLGVLDVQSEKLDYFTQEDISIQTALAGQIAVALQNARQYQETQNALARTETLLQISQAASGSLDSKDILSQTLSKIIDVTGYTSGLITIINPKSKLLEIAVQHNLPDRLLHHMTVNSLNGTLCEFVFKNNEALIIEDMSKGAPIDVSGLLALNLNAYYGLPLRSQDSSIGTLCLFSESITPYDTQIEKLLLVASQQLGNAFGNSILFEQTQIALNQSEAMYQGSQIIIEAASPQELLDAVIEFSPAKDFDNALLLTFDHEWDTTQPENVVISAIYQKLDPTDGLNAQEIYTLEQFGLDVLADPLEPVYIQNLNLDERINPELYTHLDDQLTPRSLAVFPLQVSKQFFGVILLVSTTETYLNQQEIRQIFSLIRQSGTILHSIQLRHNLENQLDEMEVLQRMMSRDAWNAYLSQSDQSKMGYVYDQVETKAISSIKMDNNKNGNGQTPSEDLSALDISFNMPLEIQGEPIGGLGLKTSEQAISDDEEFFLRSIAEQVSQALERARLIEQTQKTALELQTVAQVSATSSTVLDPEELLQSVVDLAKNSFGMYHAHIYLLDKDETQLVLTSGAGDVGRQMVQEGWVIFLDDDSIVAQAVRTRQGQIVNDVRETPDFLPNPLLPDTISELAVPMVVGNKVLGVFDVQSDRINSFSENDLQTFSTLATQTSVALQNARLFEEQSITVERLRELDHLKTSFLANMSHELRTPLNSILGFTQVILEGIDGPLTDYMISDLQLIEKNGKHLLHLINEVLDMAKIESGRMSLTIETVDLNELMSEILDTTSAQARDKAIYLDLETDPQEELVINADLIRIKQVMLNLIGNAIKFTESGGITVKAVRKAESVNIQVVDTGIGIPPDKLETIFEAFSQVDTSTTRKAGGTGLGLPISRRLVELHGGQLWAESSGEGSGTIMQVILPINAKVE